MLDLILDPYSYPFWILVIAVLVGAIAIISRPFSTYMKFVYPNAKFEAIGNPFIKDKELNRLLDIKDLSEFTESLNALKDYEIRGNSSRSIQQSLDNSFIQTIKLMQRDSSRKMNEFYKTYLEKMDAYLVKSELKNKLSGMEIKEETVDQAILSDTRKLLQKLAEAEDEKILSILKEYGFGEEVINAISDSENHFLILDTAIDRYIINKFKQVKIPYACEKGKQKFVKRMIDINNIKSILRAKQLSYDEKNCMNLFLGDGQEISSWKYKEMAQTDQVSQVISNLEGTSYFDILKDSIEEYNKDESVQVLENSLDSLYLKFVKDISIQNYVSIGPTIRFLVSKEFEIMNLKIIAKGIEENIQSDIVKNLLIKEAN